MDYPHTFRIPGGDVRFNHPNDMLTSIDRAGASVLSAGKPPGFVFFFSLFAAARALALQPSDLTVTVNQLAGSGAVQHSIQFAPGPEGTRYVDVTLTNVSDHEVRLASMGVTFPWLTTTDPKLLVSSGGTTMATWPMQVVDPAQPRPEPAHSGTYLLARHDGKYSMVAFLSWQTFWSKISYEHGRIVMTADGEDRVLEAGQSVSLERLWLVEGTDWQDMLFDYADEIARQLHIKLKPRPAYAGWSTWDYYGRKWTAANVTDNLAALLKIAPQANLLQIDGGWWPQRGDFTLVRADLQPDGMKVLAGKIRDAGMTAGIHFDGMRGDMQSRILKEHPEYFLKDEKGAIIDVPQMNDGDQLAHAFFDFSEPGAVAYMKKVTHHIRREWGYDYIKIDFLLNGLNYNIRNAAFKDAPDRRIAPHNPGLTSVERLHLALAAWREGMGSDAYFLGCSAPFGIVFGQVDGLRTGYDISPNISGVRKCAEATAGAFYLNGRVAYNDADYQVARAKEDEDGTLVHNAAKHSTLTHNEAEMWADYVGLFGGTKLNSDNLLTLRPERQEVFQQALALPSCSRYVPLDYWAHGRDREDAFHVMLGEAGDGAYLAVFNWSDKARVYFFSGLPASAWSKMEPLRGEADARPHGDGWQVRLPARHAVVFKLPAGMKFDQVRHALVLF